MASKEELLDKSFKKITHSHYECIHCGIHIKSSGILRRCAHVASIKGYDSAPCKDPNSEIQPEVIMAAKHIIDEHIKAKQRKAAAQLVRQSADSLHQPKKKQQRLEGSMASLAAAEAHSAAWGECFFECNFAFRAADNQRFKKAVKLSIAAGSGYNPLSWS